MIRHLGSSLADIAYIFDEPSVGLHARDVHHLGQLLVQLRGQGQQCSSGRTRSRPDCARADHVIDIGPGSGADGGRVVYQGLVAGLAKADTQTGTLLRKPVQLNTVPRTASGWIHVNNQSLFNIQDLCVDIPSRRDDCHRRGRWLGEIDTRQSHIAWSSLGHSRH